MCTYPQSYNETVCKREAPSAVSKRSTVPFLETMASIYCSEPTTTHTTTYAPNHLLSLIPSICLKPLLFVEHKKCVHHQKTPLEVSVLEKVQGMR